MAEKALPIDYRYLAPTTEIRILTLKKGIESDDIICTLRHVTRGEEKYHALSYEWGDESDDNPSITVAGRRVNIRRNLYDALKSIRKSSDDVELWIDAICINQADLSEKSQQVAMMGETFTNASGVIAWLGPARDNSDVAMDLMSDPEKLESSFQALTQDLSEIEIKSLVSLCYRPYWRRVWIIQELYLARSYVIWCGRKSVADEAFEGSLATMKGSDGKFDKRIVLNPANHHRMARLLRGTDLNNLRRWIWVCLRGNFQCTREQDMIYALLHISDDYKNANGALKVDYAKSPRKVFLELLTQRNLSTWNPGDKERWIDVAEKMNIQIDEELRNSITEAYSH